MDMGTLLHEAMLFEAKEREKMQLMTPLEQAAYRAKYELEQQRERDAWAEALKQAGIKI